MIIMPYRFLPLSIKSVRNIPSHLRIQYLLKRFLIKGEDGYVAEGLIRIRGGV